MSEVEVEPESEEEESGTDGTCMVGDGELCLFTEAIDIAGHQVFAALTYEGSTYLGLTSTGKMHRLEIEKNGLPPKQSGTPKLRAIKT